MLEHMNVLGSNRICLHVKCPTNCCDFGNLWAFYMFMCFLPLTHLHTHIQSYQYKYYLTDQLFESLSLAMHSKLYFVSFKFWELGIVVYLQLWLTTIPPIRQICLNLSQPLFCFDEHNSPEVMLCWFGPQVWQLLFHSRKPISTLQGNSQIDHQVTRGQEKREAYTGRPPGTAATFRELADTKQIHSAELRKPQIYENNCCDFKPLSFSGKIYFEIIYDENEAALCIHLCHTIH